MSGALLDEDVDANAQDDPYSLAPRSVDSFDHGLDLNVMESPKPKLSQPKSFGRTAVAKKQVPSRDKSNIHPGLFVDELEGNVSKHSTREACQTTGADDREDDNDHFGYDPRDFSHDFQGENFSQSFLKDHAFSSPGSFSPVHWESPGHDASQSLREVQAVLNEELPKVSPPRQTTKTLYI